VSALWAPTQDRQGSKEGGSRQAGGRALRDRGRLKPVPPPPAKMARIPFIAVLIALFGVGMAGLLMLNTTLQNQAFEGRSLTRQANELIYSQSELESEISRRASPQELARRASALGMRPNPYPVFMEMPSGKVIGDPKRVNGHEVPSLIVKTPAQEAAERRAAEAKRKAAAVEKAARDRAEQLAAARRAADARAAAEAEAAAAAAKAKQAGRTAAPRTTTNQPTTNQPTPKPTEGNR
jgi:hypothetical protein